MSIDAAELETHRTALIGHCYRMLGSSVDAEDAVQDTMVRAWRSLDRFEARASLRTWLYRIATNVCLDALNDRSRRERPMEEGPAGSVDDPLDTYERTHWLEPVADARALPADADPFHITALRQSLRLAFVSALQRLPPRQRAALLLTDIIGCSAAEAAGCLDMSVASVNSALQRARATLGDRGIAATPDEGLADADARLVERYMDAFQRYDVDGLVALVREDATFSMPPYRLWLQGPGAIRTWLLGRGAACRGSRLIPTKACGSPAFGQYRPAPGGGHEPWALVVLELWGGGIAGWNSFLDTGTLFPLFDLPPSLPA
jgi:RNA polymerase sigma-70 factor (ECF subfamily)